ncbi:maturase [Mycobacterium tuberculosis RGTB423]|nr:maturase [Mycobacterium tuberculosis RGTB423]
MRERKIPKPGGLGKVRRLGIPTVADRVVQAALKLVLEPIFETDFEPVSYGFRPARRAHDTIAEIHLFGTQEYRWVLDADIKACFDRIDHADLMDRVRHRIKDKRVLRAGELAAHSASLELDRRPPLAHRPHRAVAPHQRGRDHPV